MSDYQVKITTGSSNITVPDTRTLPRIEVTPDTMRDLHLFSPALWKGHHVWFHECATGWDKGLWYGPDNKPLCNPFEHEPYEMTHYNPDGPNWPTGFLSCHQCGGIAHDPAA